MNLQRKTEGSEKQSFSASGGVQPTQSPIGSSHKSNQKINSGSNEPKIQRTLAVTNTEPTGIPSNDAAKTMPLAEKIKHFNKVINDLCGSFQVNTTSGVVEATTSPAPDSAALNAGSKPTGCCGLKILVDSTVNNWEIQTSQLLGAHTSFNEHVVVLQPANSDIRFGNFDASGNRTTINDAVVAGHELCGHAAQNEIGIHNEGNEDRESQRHHDPTVNVQNAIALEQGIPANQLRGNADSSNHRGESFAQTTINGFEFNKDTVSALPQKEQDKIQLMADFIKTNNEWVDLKGHSDQAGNDAAKKQVSLSRANRIKEKLNALGVTNLMTKSLPTYEYTNRPRFTSIKGAGDTEPPTVGAADQANWRRVDIFATNHPSGAENPPADVPALTDATPGANVAAEKASSDPCRARIANTAFPAGPAPSPAPGAPVPVSPKLKVGGVDTPEEREADAVAEKVMRMPSNPSTPSPGLMIQRKCAACSGEEKLQRKSSGTTSVNSNEEKLQSEKLGSIKLQAKGGVGFQGGETTSSLGSAINSTRGSGSSLPSSVAADMGSKIGADFSGVRVHTGSKAQNFNTELNARAFTVGSDIYFNQGEYSPGSNEGKRLLAHELTHTVQQNDVIRKDNDTKANIIIPKSAQQFIPTCSRKIDLTGMFLIPTSEAMFEPGSKQPQLVRIVLKNLLGENYDENLVEPFTTLLSGEQFIKSGQFNETDNSYESEKIDKIFIAVEPLNLIVIELQKRKLKLNFSEAENNQLYNAYIGFLFWGDFRIMSQQEGMPIPAWMNSSLFDAILELKPELLQIYIQPFEKYKSEPSDENKRAFSEQIKILFYTILEIIIPLDEIRKDLTLNNDSSTRLAYNALWSVPDQKSGAVVPKNMGRLSVMKVFINYAITLPDDLRNAETQTEVRKKLLSEFQKFGSFKDSSRVDLPPFPAFMLSPDLNPDFTTVVTASNTFKMIVNSDSMFGTGINGVSIANQRQIYFNWEIYKMPEVMESIKNGSDSGPESMIKTADDFVKNSPENLGTSVKSFNTGTNYENNFSMSGFELGDYIVMATARPVYSEDMNWFQESSHAGHPLYIVSPEQIADKFVFSETETMKKLEDRLKDAKESDKEDIQKQIDELKVRQNLKFSDIAGKDKNDTQKLLDQAKSLKQFIESERAAKIPESGNKDINPFEMRLKQKDVTLFQLYLMISETYDMHKMSKLEAVVKFIETIEKQLEDLRKLEKRSLAAEGTFKAGMEPMRLLAGLIKKDDGNLVPLLMEVGLHPDSNLEKGIYKMKIWDVTFDSPKKGDMVYVGETYVVESLLLKDTKYNKSDLPWLNFVDSESEAREKSIHSAMIKFGEDNNYGLGLVKYNVPKIGFSSQVNSVTTNFEYLKMAIAALGLVVLVLGVVASAGTLTPAAAAVVTALGITVGVAGAILAAINIADRVEKGTFEWDFETAMDIVSIIGAVVMVAGTVRSVSIALSSASKVAKIMQMQRLEKLLFIYNVTDFSANTILIAGKYIDDIYAIKALHLPKEQEDELIESATFEAMQQGAMLAVSLHGIGKQGFDFYKAKVENTHYKSWLDKGWFEHGTDGKFKISENAPPFIREAMAKRGLVNADQTIDQLRLQEIFGSIAHVQTETGDHTLSYTKDDHVLICGDKCEKIETTYAGELKNHPEYDQRLKEIETNLKKATESKNDDLKNAALQDLQNLEAELKKSSESSTTKNNPKPDTPDPTKKQDDNPIPKSAKDNNESSRGTPKESTDKLQDVKENQPSPGRTNKESATTGNKAEEKSNIVDVATTPTTATGEVHEHKIHEDGTITRCSDRCSKLVDNATERSKEITRVFGKDDENAIKAKELKKKAAKLQEESKKAKLIPDEAARKIKQDAILEDAKLLEMDLAVLEKSMVKEVEGRTTRMLDAVNAELNKYPEYAGIFDERLKNRNDKAKEISKKLADKDPAVRQEGYEALTHELDMRKKLLKDVVAHAANVKKPNISERYVYAEKKDSAGNHVKSARGELGVPGEVMKHRNQVEQGKVSSGSGDDAGHLIANVFGAAGDKRNLGKQNWKANEFGTWRKLEIMWGEKLLAGTKISVEVSEHTHAGSDRPYKRVARWEETDSVGTKTFHELEFGNFTTEESRKATGEAPAANVPEGGATVYILDDARTKKASSYSDEDVKETQDFFSILMNLEGGMPQPANDNVGFEE